MALIVLAKPAFRIVFGKFALGHLHTRVLVEPRAIAFELLNRLGTNSDPKYVWHLLHLLLRVPNEMFDDKWLSLASGSLDDIPGDSVTERVQLCRLVILKVFGLWQATADAANAPVDYERLDR